MKSEHAQRTGRGLAEVARGDLECLGAEARRRADGDDVDRGSSWTTTGSPNRASRAFRSPDPMPGHPGPSRALLRPARRTRASAPARAPGKSRDPSRPARARLARRTDRRLEVAIAGDHDARCGTEPRQPRDHRIELAGPAVRGQVPSHDDEVGRARAGGVHERVPGGRCSGDASKWKSDRWTMRVIAVTRANSTRRRALRAATTVSAARSTRRPTSSTGAAAGIRMNPVGPAYRSKQADKPTRTGDSSRGGRRTARGQARLERIGFAGAAGQQCLRIDVEEQHRVGRGQNSNSTASHSRSTPRASALAIGVQQ